MEDSSDSSEKIKIKKKKYNNLRDINSLILFEDYMEVLKQQYSSSNQQIEVFFNEL